MKILVSWLFDHLQGDTDNYCIQSLVEQFIVHTAEIEEWESLQFDPTQFTLVQVKQVEKQGIQAFSEEYQASYTLPYRSDAKVDYFYIAKQEDSSWVWATCQDWGGIDKEGLLPAMTVPKSQRAGDWKKNMITQDYVIEVDNKSINHRPDLWSHRGIAREIAQYTERALVSEQELLYPAHIVEYEKTSTDQSGSYSIDLQAPEAAPRFAGWYTDAVHVLPSFPWVAQRLLAVGGRPINALVDLTNYVMFDVGQPMHAFDGQAFSEKKVVVRHAQNGEILTLLDDTEVKLEQGDLVVADTKNPVALAGVMGGKQASSSETMTTLFAESIACDPTLIRKTAQRVKTRTEASMRFEKHLDPMQNIIALQRFMRLGLQQGVLEKITEPIVSVGITVQPPVCVVKHAYIQKRLGIQIDQTRVIEILHGLGFHVQISGDDNDSVYQVTVPTWRATKDITIPDDIVEEVGRIYGYNHIPYILPQRDMAPFSFHEVMQRRNIKDFLAYSLHMHEVRDYAFYDQNFLRRIQYQPKGLQVHNPVSENWTTLVTSLVPHLLKTVEKNIHTQSSLHFFEMNAIWSDQSQKQEQQSLAGIWFEQKMAVSFYAYKARLQQFFAALKMPVTWKKAAQPNPWFDAPETAELWCQDTCIGIAGMLDPDFYGSIMQGSGFAFELDAAFLETWSFVTPQFVPWSKYQHVEHDVSSMLPYACSVDRALRVVEQAHAYITHVQQVDYFEKPEWKTERSVTFRYVVQNPEATLTKQELEHIEAAVHTALESIGGKVRA